MLETIDIMENQKKQCVVILFANSAFLHASTGRLSAVTIYNNIIPKEQINATIPQIFTVLILIKRIFEVKDTIVIGTKNTKIWKRSDPGTSQSTGPEVAREIIDPDSSR